MYYKADIFLHIPWNAKHLSMFVENGYLIRFDYTDFLILINSFTTNPGYWQIYVEHILTRSALPLARYEAKTDLMCTSMKNYVFPLISCIILPKVFTLCYPVDLEMLAIIY